MFNSAQVEILHSVISGKNELIKLLREAIENFKAHLRDNSTLKPGDTHGNLYTHNDNILQLNIEAIITTTLIRHMHNLRKTKWLLICSCNPLNSNIAYHLNSLGKILDHNLAQYDRILLIADLNLETTGKYEEYLCYICHLKNLIKETICLTILMIPLILIYTYNLFEKSPRYANSRNSLVRFS